MKTNGLPSLPNTPAAEHEQPTWQDDEISILDLLLVIIRNRRFIRHTVLLFTSIGLLIAIFAQPQYTVTAKVIREAIGEDGGGFSGLTMLRGLGLNIGSRSSGLSVEAYSDVLTSHEVLLAVVRDSLYIPAINARAPFVEYANRPGILTSMFGFQSPGHRDGEHLASQKHLYVTEAEEAAMETLREMQNVSVDNETGLMMISVTSEHPQLSADLVRCLISHLSERIRQIHTEKAQQNLDFIRSRFENAQRELRDAEEELARFLDRNHSPQTASLRTQLERLQRNVTFKSELYSELQTQLTQAEIELQKVQPVLTVVEQPIPPTKPTAPNRILAVLVCLGIGLMLGITLSFVKTALEHQKEDDLKKVEELRSALLPRFLANRIEITPYTKPET